MRILDRTAPLAVLSGFYSVVFVVVRQQRGGVIPTRPSSADLLPLFVLAVFTHFPFGPVVFVVVAVICLDNKSLESDFDPYTGLLYR